MNSTVKFTTINVDGIKISRTWESIDEMRKDWHDAHGTTLPSLDDKLISATVEGVEFKGETFGDLAKFIDLDNITFLCFGGYGAEESCEHCCNAERCKEFTANLDGKTGE